MPALDKGTSVRMSVIVQGETSPGSEMYWCKLLGHTGLIQMSGSWLNEAVAIERHHTTIQGATIEEAYQRGFADGAGSKTLKVEVGERTMRMLAMGVAVLQAGMIPRPKGDVLESESRMFYEWLKNGDDNGQDQRSSAPGTGSTDTGQRPYLGDSPDHSVTSGVRRTEPVQPAPVVRRTTSG